MSTTASAFPIIDLCNSGPSPSPRFFVSFGPTTSTGPLLPWGKTTRERKKIAVLRVSAGGGNWGSLRDGRRRTGLLERPTFDHSQFDPLPQPQQGGDMGQVWDKIGLGNGDSYRVLLVDAARHTEKLVEKALPQVVPSVTVSDARKLFHESRQNGVAVVIVAVKEHAEFYAQMMIRWGLRSAIEPDSSVA